MPVTVTRYGVNLFSLNSLGDDWLGHRVTTANFRGPPIVLVSTVVDGADPDIEAVVAFAALWNAPLIAFDRSVGFGSWALSTLASACIDGGKLFVSNHFQTFDLPIGILSTRTLPICGPWIALETGGPATTIDAWAALATNNFSRTGQNHPYACGLQGVSHFNAYIDAPPLYRVGLTDVAGDLARLRKKWEGSAVPTVAQYEAIIAAAAIRPGLARLCNPAMLPELVVIAPV